MICSSHQGTPVEQILHHEYDGYINRFAKWITGRLPATSYLSWEDAQAEVRKDAIEATVLFDPDRGASFSTFLYVHLNTRARDRVRRAWSAKRTPGGQTVFLSSQNKEHYEGIGENPVSFRTPEITYQHRECFESLSDEAKQTFGKLLQAKNFPNLLHVLGTKYRRSYVTRMAGVSKEEFDSLVAELREVYPKHFEVCV
jgi:hypothetical protein